MGVGGGGGGGGARARPYPLPTMQPERQPTGMVASPAGSLLAPLSGNAAAYATSAFLQGLTLVHSSAQLEPCLTQKNTPHTPNAP